SAFGGDAIGCGVVADRVEIPNDFARLDGKRANVAIHRRSDHGSGNHRWRRSLRTGASALASAGRLRWRCMPSDLTCCGIQRKKSPAARWVAADCIGDRREDQLIHGAISDAPLDAAGGASFPDALLPDHFTLLRRIKP